MIVGRWIASAASLSFTVTLMMSHPASAACRIWATVAATSEVFVFVIVCTEMGASAPIRMPPTVTRRVFRRMPTLYVGCFCGWMLTSVTVLFRTGKSADISDD